MTTIIQAVREYLKAGLHPIPLLKGKSPGIVGWTSRDFGPGDFVGVERVGIRGTGGIVIIDVDVKNGTPGAETYARLGPWPETATVSTPSGGRHYYYRVPDGCQIGNARPSDWYGVDVRGVVGHCCAPPTDGYEWIVGLEGGIAPLPAPVLDALLAVQPEVTEIVDIPVTLSDTTSDQGREKLDAMRETVCAAKAGSRNDVLNREAYHIWRWVGAGAISETDAESMLTAAGLMAGLSPREVSATVQSARSGIQNPILCPARAGAMFQKHCDEDGKLYRNLSAYVGVLSGHPHWQGRLRFNVRRGREEAVAPLPMPGHVTPVGMITDTHLTVARMWFEAAYGVRIPEQDIDRAISIAARGDTFDVVREYLEGLGPWDGVERLDTMLIQAFGVEDTPYVRAVSRAWMIGAVKRTFEPGCHYEPVLVLEGPQGCRKTTFLRELFDIAPGVVMCGEMSGGVESKDTLIRIHGPWCLEMAELASLNKSEVEHIKAFLSTAVDEVRFPYAKRAVELPRRCVFAATTNDYNWQRDISGARRFWPVRCQRTRVGHVTDRDLLWAEALSRYRAGEGAYLAAEHEAEHGAVVEEREEVDPLLEVIMQRVEEAAEAELTPLTWDGICVWLNERPGGIVGRRASRVVRCLERLGFARYRDGRRTVFYRQADAPVLLPKI